MRIFFKFFPVLFLAVFTFSCNKSRSVVPCDSDTAEVFKALEPNEEDSPDNLTFGAEQVPGFIFDSEFTTENQDVYIYFQNLTVLDVNPAITQSLFEFIQDQLKDNGFINENSNLSQNEFLQLIESGLSYNEAAAQLLDIQKKEFETQVDSINNFSMPFNIYFQIYPVWMDTNYITYRETSYAYTGGAHGLTVSHLITYDLQSGNEMTLNDLVKPEALETVREEVVAHMAYSYPIYENISTISQYIDSLNAFVGDVDGDGEPDNNKITLKNYPLPNPALTKDGLAFVYQMYVLTPGSDGCPVVVIPYKDIKGCLSVNIP